MKTVVSSHGHDAQLPDRFIAHQRGRGDGSAIVHVKNAARVSELKDGRVRVRGPSGDDHHIPDAEILETIAD